MSTSRRGPRARKSRTPRTTPSARRPAGLRRNVRLAGLNRSLLNTRLLYRHTRGQGGAIAAIALPFVDPDVLAPPPSTGDPDNLILTALKDQDIQILWGGFDDAYPGDRITFRYNGADFDTVEVVGTETPPFVGVLQGAKAWAREGTNLINVWYEGLGGSGELSAAIPFTIDTRKAGAPILAALLFDPADDVEGTGITLAKLRTDADGEYLWAEVPSYGLHSPDDTIVVYCNGTAGDPAKATVVAGHIELRIRKELLEEVGDTNAAVFWYTVTRRSGAVSDDSHRITVALQLGQITSLEEPLVPAYDDDPDEPDNPPLIDDADARGPTDEGFVIEIPWNDEFQPTDQIVVFLDTEGAGLVNVGPPGESMQVPFPYSGTHAVWLAGSRNGADDVRIDAEVSYEVFRGSASIGASPPHAVVLNLYQKAIDPDPDTPENERLVAPVVFSSSGMRDEIPVDDFGLDGSIQIAKRTDPAYPPRDEALEEGDTLRIFYGTQPPIQFEVPALDDVTEPFSVPLPGDVIASQGSGDDIPVWYEVVHALADGGTNTNLSPSKEIDVRGKDTQPGRGHLDAGEFLDEDASGFIPEKPFHYSSTRFAIPDYANRGADDEIQVRFELYRGPTHLPGEIPYEPAKYTWTDKLSAGVDDPIVYILPASTYNLYGNPDGLSAYIHIHATYTVTKKSGDTTPVTADEAGVKVDARFSSGAAASNSSPDTE
jgi:hypothetical protein